MQSKASNWQIAIGTWPNQNTANLTAGLHGLTRISIARHLRNRVKNLLTRKDEKQSKRLAGSHEREISRSEGNGSKDLFFFPRLYVLIRGKVFGVGVASANC
jgi:hypothetical protein